MVSTRKPARGAARRSSAAKKRKRTIWKLALPVLLLGALLIGSGILARRMAPSGNTDRERFDALIVLGYPADGQGRPTPIQQARVREAVREFERGVAPRLILSGGAAHNGYVEAETMARAAEAEGVAPAAIFLETHSLDTLQNACYSTRLMREHGWKSAEIISSSSHLPRAGLIFSSLPIDWRTHAAPMLGGGWLERSKLDEAAETIKTVRFLLWARLTERCQP